MKKRVPYFYLHLFHALFVVLLLVTGAALYSDALRPLISSVKWELRQFHSVLGIAYFLFLIAATPYAFRYLRSRPNWHKTFHVCLMMFLGLGWVASGLYLWFNVTEYLGLRQLSIRIHDLASVFAVPWILGHIAWWYFRKTKIFKSIRPWRQSSLQSGDPVSGPAFGPAISRRDVVILFAGAVASLALGGLFRWYRPVSERFLAGLDVVKRRGYFRIYSVRSDNPSFDPASWRLSVGGLVGQPKEFTFDELMNMPKLSYVHDFHCVTGWSVLGVEWEGIPFHTLVKLVRPKPEAKYVKMYSADQMYTETYEIGQLLQQNVILAYKLDGKPLSSSQGAPLRLFHPGMYGYKSIKWLNRIEFTSERGLGYWEEKEGYDLNGYIG